MTIRVTCTQCGAAYKIDESKIPPTGGAVKCQACGNRFPVIPGAPAAATAPTPATTSAPASTTSSGVPGPPPVPVPSIPKPPLMGDEETTAPSKTVSLPNRNPTAARRVPGETNPGIALPGFGGGGTNPGVKMPVKEASNSAIPLPAAPGGTNPRIPMPVAKEATNPAIPLPAAPGGTNPRIQMPVAKEATNPAIPLPAAPGGTNPRIQMPVAKEATNPGIPLPTFSEGTNPRIRAPGSSSNPAIPLPSFGEITNPTLTQPTFKEATNPNIRIPLPSGPVHDNAPITLDEDDSLFSGEEKTEVIAPLVLPPPPARPETSAPEVIEEVDEIIEEPDEAETLVGPRPTADDTTIEEAPQFAGITLQNATSRPVSSDDLPAPVNDASAPLSLGPVTFAPTTMGDAPSVSDDLPAPLAPPADDLPAPAAADADLPQPVSFPPEDDLPSPLAPQDLPQSDDGATAPEALATEPMTIGPPGFAPDDLPTPLEASAPAPAADARATASEQIADEGTDEEAEELMRRRVKGGRRLSTRAMLVAAVVLFVIGGIAVPFLVTGEMPWALLQQPAAPTPTEPAPVEHPVPPVPDFALVQGRDLDAYLKALAVLDERRAARKAKNEPEQSREDDAVRARLLWQGAVLLGSRAMAAELQKLPATQEGVEPHPHEERAEAARAWVAGDSKGMAERLDKLLARDKGDKDAHLLYGYALLAAEDTVNAGKHFDEVLRIDEVGPGGKKSMDALLGQAEIARRTGDIDSATGFLDKAEEQGKGVLRVRLLRAELDHDTGAREASEKAIKDMAAHAQNLGERDRARLRWLSASYAASAGNARAARAELEQAWADEPSARVARALAWSKLVRNEQEGVAELIEKGRALDDGAFAESLFLAEVTASAAAGDPAKTKEIIAAATKAGVAKRATAYAEGVSLEAQKKVPAALKFYSMSAKLDKQFSLPALADVRLRKQPPKLKLMRLAIFAKNIGDAPTLAAYGDALYETESFAMAAEKYRAALDKDPWVLDLPEMAKRLADAYGRAGDKRAAARMAIANADVDPKSVDGLLGLVAIAKTAEAYDEAQRLVEAGLDEHPKENRLLLALAEVQIHRGSRERARSLLLQVLKAEEKNPLVHELLALSYHPDDPELVKMHVKNAIELAPRTARYYVLLGDSYLAKEKYDEAKDAFERALEIDPRNLEVMLSLARIADQQGNKKGAIERYRKALELEPERLQTVLDLAERLEDNGEGKEAFELLTQAQKRDPQNAALLIGMGRIQHANGNRLQAIKFFKLALKHNPQEAQAFYRLGYLYKDAGNNKEARKMFELYLKHNPKADDRKDIEAEIAELR